MLSVTMRQDFSSEYGDDIFRLMITQNKIAWTAYFPRGAVEHGGISRRV
jgi:hypothetical protein